MYYLRLIFIFNLIVSFELSAASQVSDNHFLVKPFQDNVFIKEQGQFRKTAQVNKAPFKEPVFYGIENAEFNAYFTSHGIIFQFPERKRIEKKDRKSQKEESEEKGVETIWHTVTMLWLNTDTLVSIVPEQKVSEYYNYGTFEDKTSYNLIPAFKKLKYTNLYPGVDAEFELAAEGGIKYRFIVQPNVIIPTISFQWEGLEKLNIDEEGILHLKSKFKSYDAQSVWQLLDHAPNAFTSSSKTNIPVGYSIMNNKVEFKFSDKNISSPEGIVIDPWITNTSFSSVNRAYDIQEDSLGNVYVIGNVSNWEVQKFDSNGTLLWTYVTYATLMGDIAVDNPGNVYIVGGYSTGKRQKLNTAGVQLWSFSGLSEEWRLSFNYSKTILSEGGYFNGSPGDNLCQLNINTGAISNLMVYGAETRGLATDCNGDIYSLHVTFGYTGLAASNLLRKTNANFTPAGSVGTGFLLSEAQPAGTGYGLNPAYAADIYQVLNAIVVNGPYVFIYDGATLKSINKNTLTILNSVSVPNGIVTMCGGVAADLCGNIYVGSTTGIEKFDSSLTHIATIPTPGAVYDLILGFDGGLLACGAGFVGSFSSGCIPPSALISTATSTNKSCKGGTATAIVSGGTAPYSYLWLPGGQTTSTAANLSPGTYTYTVTDPFCHSFQDTITVFQTPLLTLGPGLINVISPGVINNESCPNSFDGSAIVTASGGKAPYSYFWNTTPIQYTQTATGLSQGIYLATVVDADTCMDTISIVINRGPRPIANFNSTKVCNGDATQFTDSSFSAAGSIVSRTWDYGDSSPLDININPSHIFINAGNYTVTLIINTSLGCADTITKSIKVYYNPIANFTHTDICLGEPMNFINTSYVDTSAALSTYSWSFGDGTPPVSTQTPVKYFTTPGTFNVTLITTTNNGCKDTIIKNVVVHPLPTAKIASANVCDGRLALFGDLSTIPVTDTIGSWQWTFGDNSAVSNSQNTSHLYAAPGSYSSKLLVVSNFGCRDSITKIIVVNPNPVASFTANDTTGCELLCISFQNSSLIASGSNVNWDWDLGDGSSVTNSESFDHCYSNDSIYSPNYFNITLTVTSDSGCINVLAKNNYITVYPNPTANFIVQPETTTYTDPVVSITDLSIGANFWNWNFGDLTSSSVFNPVSHTYPDTGTFVVNLLVSTQFGCIDTASKKVIIEPDFIFYIPNAFTPDGDGINDNFTGKGVFIVKFEMRIFDRWGNLIYYADDINKPWDGKANRGSKEAQADVYVYDVKVTDLKRKMHTYKGIVTLVR
jgi:gliding motility-associated-like protein